MDVYFACLNLTCGCDHKPRVISVKTMYMVRGGGFVACVDGDIVTCEICGHALIMTEQGNEHIRFTYEPVSRVMYVGQTLAEVLNAEPWAPNQSVRYERLL